MARAAGVSIGGVRMQRARMLGAAVVSLCSASISVAGAQANVVRTQPVQLLFETVVPETPGGSGTAVRQLSQHRYLVAGYVAPAGQSTDGLLVWVDSGGSVVRQRRFGGDGNDYLWDAHELSDGGIVAIGSTTTGTRGDADVWMLRLDSAGSTLWERRFGTRDDDRAWAMTLLRDGGFLLLGQSGARDHEDAFVVRTDAAGGAVWTKRIGGPGSDRALAMSVTPRGIAAAGMSTGSATSVVTPWAFELNLDGTLLWEQRYASLSGSTGQGIAPAVGGFLLTGYGTSPIDSVNQRLFVRLSASGAMVQASRIPTSGESRAMMSVPTPTGGHVALGAVSGERGWDVQLTGLSEAVAPTWQAMIPRAGDERGVHMISTPDGGWILTGNSTAAGAPAGAVLIIKWRR